MKKTTMVLASAALLASVPASAGEYSGSGKYVPGGDNGASECSYSGLNDGDGDGLGFTQTFAAVLKAMGLDSAARYFNPGLFCRGNG